MMRLVQALCLIAMAGLFATAPGVVRLAAQEVGQEVGQEAGQGAGQETGQDAADQYRQLGGDDGQGGRVLQPGALDSLGETGLWDYGAVDATAAAQDGGGTFTPGAYEQLSQNNGSMLDRSQQGVAAFRERLQAILDELPGAWAAMGETLRAASPTGDPWYFLNVALVVFGGLTIGFLFERLVYGYRIVGPWFVARQVAHPQGYVEKLPILALRVLLTAGGIALSCAVALLLGLVFYEPNEATQKTAIVILATYAIFRLMESIWRMILAPYLPNYRIPNLSDRQAIRLYRWLYYVGALSLGILAFCLWMDSLGLPLQIHVILTSGLTLVTVLLNLALIRANYSAISHAILGGAGASKASVLASAASVIWAPLAILYFVVAWAEMSYRLVMDQPLGVPLIAGAYFVLLALIVVYGAVSYVIEWVFRRQRLIRELNDASEAGEPAVLSGAALPGGVYRMRTMEDLARRVASIMALIAGAWAILWIWDAQDAMMGEGGVFFDKVFSLLITAFIGYVLYQATRIAIDQRIEEEGGSEVAVEPGDEGGGAAAATRLATLLPLFRNFLMVTIGIVTIMMLLLESGVNVTPLFAGAGVVGLAIGFGAQTLVRDIFSGAFFLIDDAFRKGEYIDIGAVKGTVEKISVRSFQLRHHLGYLHTIPFGEVQHLTNYSRDWVIMKLPLRLTYDTDVEKVRKLVKKLGQDLLEDPEIGEKFLQPVKSQGVYQMEESAMIIRVKFMTRPGEQWIIRKRVYAEIRELFEREGIKFAHREVTVHVAGKGAEQMSEDEKKAVAGAARPLLDPPEEDRPMAAVQDDR